MSLNIIKQLNADAQEGAATNDVAETAAVTNVPAERSDIVGSEAAELPLVATPKVTQPVSVDRKSVV